MSLEEKLQALVAELKKLRKGWDDLADAMDGHHNFDYRCALQQCEAELGLFIPKLEALLAERQPVCIGYPDCDGDLEGEPHSEKCLAERQKPPLVEKLAQHWLSQMDCDHNMKRDRAICCCGFVTIWEPTVGDAAKAWAEHALTAAAQPSSGTGAK